MDIMATSLIATRISLEGERTPAGAIVKEI
jgi:hypothetical protein